MAIFSIFNNGRHQFSISIDTRKTGDPNFRGVGNWEFCSRTCFWGAMAIFPIFSNGRYQFYISVDTQKTVDPNFKGLVFGSFALGHIFGELQPFFPLSIMADTNFLFPLTLGKPETQTLRGVSNWEFCSRMCFGGATAIFSIFCNGRHQHSDTWKTLMTFLHLKGQNGSRKFSVDSVFPLVQFPLHPS